MIICRFQWKDKISWGIVEEDTIFSLEGDVYGDFSKGKKLCQLPDVRLLAPAEPRITVACGLNYIGHIKELGFSVSDEPSLFFKPPNTIIGPDDAIPYPDITKELCYEGELCAVIKREAKNVPEEQALDYVLGYTCGNDLTIKGLWPDKDRHITRAKGFDKSGPIGPFVVTGLDPYNLNIKSRLNGELKQDANTGEMVFGVKKLVSHISSFLTLQPGDVVWTGTPKGGLCPVKVGDTIEVEIEGIGILRNKVVAPNDASLKEESS